MIYEHKLSYSATRLTRADLIARFGLDGDSLNNNRELFYIDSEGDAPKPLSTNWGWVTRAPLSHEIILLTFTGVSGTLHF